MASTAAPAYRYEKLAGDYSPSLEAWNFHRHMARFRFLIWGIKGGKTQAGAQETARAALAMPGARIWVVAPTYAHLDEAERELLKVLRQFPGLVVGRHRSKHEIYLSHGGMIQCKSGEIPDNLRGPNVHFAWFDEAGFGKQEANYILRERVAATGGEIIYTTTPHGRNWIWNEVQIGGMPSSQAYGEFERYTNDGGCFVSHFPTWHFPWVDDGDIEGLRQRMSKQIFDQEVGAMFMSDASRAFPPIEPFMTTSKPKLSKKAQLVMGLDLAKFQDWTAIIIMDGSGKVIHMDRWNEISWNIQKPRIVRISKQWNAAIVMDRANVGSVIYDDLLGMGLDVHAVDMNSPLVKNNLIEQLIISFENGEITVPDPKAEWAPHCAEQLCSEIEWYERGKTTGNRITYSAPKGLTDDMVVALALANQGRARGMADSLDAAGVAISAEEYSSLLDEEQEAMNNGEDEQEKFERELMRLPSMRPQTFSNIFKNRRSSVGFNQMGGGLFR